ncbi:UDP-N-acetylmuramyl pentapeptide phosphotransferase [Geothermobacter hydrogeniphilus]|uniref:UDP-N-acetylmuramyl pentapeptide phosphotransferase n=1 Tax=Geothermobacter hydrogeniphilus TaxID=1969733 RepID=A0A2K2H5T8_9BACT|nr:UDP-N-acetylmuramyl pentapeptide phosphotransferase [Geothermobacter hydrogeniphilus]PNU18668.1 UDP-N-acetylmuramyl pentapeptide phosphotransferase [Geothermobacter hydrogeniphilus]
MLISTLFLNALLGFAGAWFMARFAFQLGLVDLPNERSSHVTPTPRGGGIGILFGLCLTGLLTHVPLLFWLPAAGLSVVSFFDDRLDLTPRLRLLLQFSAAVAVLLVANGDVAWPIRIPLFLFFAVFIVGTANFYNFMDGINGIAGITGLVTFSLVALFAHQGQAPAWMTLLAAGLAAACLGFLPFNVPRARVFMGDVGSVLLGFAYAGLVCLLSTTIPGFICLISFLFMFYADALTTLYIRKRDGEKLSQAHRRHLYQVLCNERGIAHWKVSCCYGLIQILIGGGMLLAYNRGLWWQLGWFLICGVLFLAVTTTVRAAAGRAAVEGGV